MSQQDPDIPQTYIVLSKIPMPVCIHMNLLETVLQLPWTSVNPINHSGAPHDPHPTLAKMSRNPLQEISRLPSACCHVEDVNGHQKVEFLVGLSVAKDTI